MLTSCKISFSILSYLEKKGIDIKPLLEKVDTPEEFLRDPSYWMEAKKMEEFLSTAERHFSWVVQDRNLVEDVGHNCRQIQAWGVLDNVLRMMRSPKEIYWQPQNLLSYFLSPPPPVGGITRGENSVSFALPMSPESTPQVSTYIRSALEGLVGYVGGTQASVDWNEPQMTITWLETQESFFDESDPGHSVSPNLIQSIVQSLEANQQSLEKKNRELLEKNNELENAKAELEMLLRTSGAKQNQLSLTRLTTGFDEELQRHISGLLDRIHRLNDYMVRMNQLITLFSGNERLRPQQKIAMKRVDFDFIRHEYPQLVQQSLEGVHDIQSLIRDFFILTDAYVGFEGQKERVNIRQLIERSIEKIRLLSPHLNSECIHYFPDVAFDHNILAYPTLLQKVLISILRNAVQSLVIDQEGQGPGKVSIQTSQSDLVFEIKVADNGAGMDQSTLNRVFSPFFAATKSMDRLGLGLSVARAVIEMHGGKIEIASHKNKGTEVTIQLPSD